MPAKVTVLSGLHGELAPTARAALVAALEAAVPGVEIAPTGQLECPLALLADAAGFDRFTVFLSSALAVARATARAR